MTHECTSIGMKFGLVIVFLLGLLSPATAQVCVLPPAGLLGWWTGDLDGTDRTVNENHAQLQNGAMAGVAGLVDGAFSFDGQDDIAPTPLVLPAIGTVDFWVNPTALSGGNFLGTFGNNVNDRLWIGFQGTSLLVNLGHGSVNDFVIPFPLAIGQWTHVALSFDYQADVYTLYVDGQVVASSTALREAPTQIFSLGGVQSNFNQNFFFNGLLDEVAVFDRVLGPDEIEAIFKAGSAGKCKGDPPAVPSLENHDTNMFSQTKIIQDRVEVLLAEMVAQFTANGLTHNEIRSLLIGLPTSFPDAATSEELTQIREGLQAELGLVRNDVQGLLKKILDMQGTLEAESAMQAVHVQAVEVSHGSSGKVRRWLLTTTLEGQLVDIDLEKVLAINVNREAPAIVEDVTVNAIPIPLSTGLLDVTISMPKGSRKARAVKFDVHYENGDSTIHAHGSVLVGSSLQGGRDD